MTIEEFADLEIADAQERSEREKAAAAHKPTIEGDMRRRDQLEEESDEEDTGALRPRARAERGAVGRSGSRSTRAAPGTRGGPRRSPVVVVSFISFLILRC